MQVCTTLQTDKITMPAPHHSGFYRPDAFLPPNQQRQSTEGKALKVHKVQEITSKGTQLTTRKWANQYPGRRLAVKCQNVGR